MYTVFKARERRNHQPENEGSSPFWGRLISCRLAFLFVCSFIQLISMGETVAAKPSRIQSLYGQVTIEHPLINALMTHPAIKRMKSIDNAGPSRYFRSLPTYSLFDHALGVFVILKRFKRPFKEQLAGMLEPIAHSVFSHQGTLYLRPKGSHLPYYLAAHEAYLKTVKIEPWLLQEGFTAKSLSPIDPNFSALYKNPPFLSAIEIEMTLRLAYSYKLLTTKEITRIMDDLRFEEGRWFFVSEKSAEKLGRLSLYFTERYWGAPQSYVVNRWVAAAIKRAVDLGSLRLQDIRFGLDKPVLQKLMHLKDKVIHGLLVQCRQPFRFYEVVDTGPYDEIYKPEFRGLNPLVKHGAQYSRLTQLDADYKSDFSRLRETFLTGIKIKFKKPGTKKRGFQEFNGGSFAGAKYKLSMPPIR